MNDTFVENGLFFFACTISAPVSPLIIEQKDNNYTFVAFFPPNTAHILLGIPWRNFIRDFFFHFIFLVIDSKHYSPISHDHHSISHIYLSGHTAQSYNNTRSLSMRNVLHRGDAWTFQNTQQHTSAFWRKTAQIARERERGLFWMTKRGK